MATTSPISATQFDALPYDEGRRWELLEGELIEVSSPTPEHQDIVFAILSALRRYLEEEGDFGRAYADVEFALTSDSRLRPDVAVLLAEKALTLNRRQVPIPFAPDIAIEVISPTERSVASQSKARTYLRNGTSEVWQVYPNSRSITVHQRESSYSLDDGQQITSDLLPGFTSLVAAFFDSVATDPNPV